MKMKWTLLLLLIALTLNAENATLTSTDTVRVAQQVLADQTNLALKGS